MNINNKINKKNKIIKQNNKTLSLKDLKLFYIVGSATFIFLLDQITKFLVRKTMAVGTSIKLLPFFSLTHLENTGTFFGLAKHSSGFFAFFAVLVIGTVLYNYKEIPEDKFLYFMFAFVLGGAFGNLIDRIFFGSVTDFFNFGFWPTFNIADSFITIAVIGLVWYAFKKEK